MLVHVFVEQLLILGFADRSLHDNARVLGFQSTRILRNVCWRQRMTVVANGATFSTADGTEESSWCLFHVNNALIARWLVWNLTSLFLVSVWAERITVVSFRIIEGRVVLRRIVHSRSFICWWNLVFLVSIQLLRAIHAFNSSVCRLKNVFLAENWKIEDTRTASNGGRRAHSCFAYDEFRGNNNFWPGLVIIIAAELSNSSIVVLVFWQSILIIRRLKCRIRDSETINLGACAVNILLLLALALIDIVVCGVPLFTRACYGEWSSITIVWPSVMNGIFVGAEDLVILINFKRNAVSFDNGSFAVHWEGALFFVFIRLVGNVGYLRNIGSLLNFLSDGTHAGMVCQRREDALRHLLVLKTFILWVSKLHKTGSTTWGSFGVFKLDTLNTGVDFSLVFRSYVITEERVLKAGGSCWPFLRVPLEHLENKVDCFRGSIWNYWLEGRYRTAREVDSSLTCQLITLSPVSGWGSKD